jgi:hypothetical protein
MLGDMGGSGAVSVRGVVTAGASEMLQEAGSGRSARDQSLPIGSRTASEHLILECCDCPRVLRC